MRLEIRNRTDYSELEKEAIHKYHYCTYEVFQEFYHTISKKDSLIVSRVLNIGIYNLNFSSIEYTIKYMPSEIMFTKQTSEVAVNHHFKFEITLEGHQMIIGYKHYLSEVPEINQGGITDIWCNPFEGDKISNYLISKKVSAIDYREGLISIYEFLIENDIIK